MKKLNNLKLIDRYREQIANYQKGRSRGWEKRVSNVNHMVMDDDWTIGGDSFL